jgi:RES domain
MTRQRIFLKDPPKLHCASHTSAIPIKEQKDLEGSVFVRCTDPSYPSPWWFSATGAGRFDPAGSGYGACYLANDEIGALHEVLGDDFEPGAYVDPVDLVGKTYWYLEFIAAEFVNLLDDKCNGLGITNEIFTVTPYTLPQQWASWFLPCFLGLVVRLRNSTDPKRMGLVLFGSESPPAAGSDPRFRVKSTSSVDYIALLNFQTATGILVTAPPTSSSGLTVVTT